MSVVWSEAVIPGLALLLFICCGTELVLRRFFKGRSILFRRSSARRPLTGHAFDEFNLIFNGNKLVEIKQQQQQEMLRDDEGDGAPPRTRIDLNKGIASVVLPGENGAGDAWGAGGDRAPVVGGRSGAPDADSRAEALGASERSEAPGADGRSETPDADRPSEAPDADSRADAPNASERSEVPGAGEGGPDAEEGSSR
ncbi:DUF6191 domain-containing protein [Streptomyces sp. NRRL S-920]|uniref:DUF6191 domain-containing protein n=1 Tax=Streptomyces sp. NRRL S-920 TaxID=1463921 RepID=UPI0005621B33|nr:DUF6191 domain-containing protein [Streptomyces sp. NRRL S-920]